jgi:diguanylate cyclase (GGDEF)-like protein
MRQTLDPVLAPLTERWPDTRVLVLDREAGALLAWWPRRHDDYDSAAGADRPPADVVAACREVVLTGQVGCRPLITLVGSREVCAARMRWGDEDAIVALVRPNPSPPASELFELAVEVCDRLMTQASAPAARTRLDDLVTDVATALAGVTATALSASLDEVVEMAGRFFAVDTCFLRRHDFEAKASVLVAEWPARRDVVDPDPLGVVPFEVDDPVFGAIETLDAPLVILPSSDAKEYQQRVFAGSGVPKVSLAMVPLRSSEQTVGVLGFIHFGERAWSDSEVRALRAIAGLITQVLARVDAEQQLHHLAFRDALTGLANRRAFLEDIQSRLDDPDRCDFALAFVDLDRLKTMNDILGHAVGDAMLVASGTRMAAAVGPNDLVARLGGDEFVVVFDGIESAEVATAEAERLLAELRRPVPIGISPLHRSASIGVVLAGEGKTSADELLRAADVALLQAKSNGGDRVVVFNEVLQRRSMQRADLELRLENAISEGELELFFQPEFDLRSRQILAAEALVRWRHPERGLLDASEFIGVVEETNGSRRLGRWVQEHACRQLAEWSELVAGRPFVMRINVTPAEFLAADFVDDFRATLARHRVRPQQICMEITEGAVMRDVPGVVAALRMLRRDGVLLAIDDFGTGHSSLAQLKNLPVDVLKIDASFVAGLEEGRGGRAIVSGVVGLARSLGLQTVVEGVETEAEAATLLELGCRRAQGYLVAPAVPAHEFVKILTSSTPAGGVGAPA